MNILNIITNWGLVEPILGWFSFAVEMTAVISAAMYIVRQKKSKTLRAKMAGEGEFVVAALGFGHDVAGLIYKQFGWKADLNINTSVMFGHDIITDDDFKKIVKLVRQWAQANQHKELRIFSSAPVGHMGLLGQALGPGYNIVWYQFDLASKKYRPLPPVAAIL